MLAKKFNPSRNVAALITALGGDVQESGGQTCFKKPCGVFGGYVFYEMTITGSTTFTSGGAAVTFMESFATGYPPKITHSYTGSIGNSYAGTVAGISETGFSGYTASSSIATDWIATGLYLEAVP